MQYECLIRVRGRDRRDKFMIVRADGEQLSDVGSAAVEYVTESRAGGDVGLVSCHGFAQPGSEEVTAWQKAYPDAPMIRVLPEQVMVQSWVPESELTKWTPVDAATIKAALPKRRGRPPKNALAQA